MSASDSSDECKLPVIVSIKYVSDRHETETANFSNHVPSYRTIRG